MKKDRKRRGGGEGGRGGEEKVEVDATGKRKEEGRMQQVGTQK